MMRIGNHPEIMIVVPSAQATQFLALDNWFKTPQGLRVAEAFVSTLKKPCDLFSGRSLLQLGGCGNNPWLPSLRFRQQWVVSPADETPNIDIFASLLALPIERSSVDCVVAPLTLEAFGANKNPMDEIDRVLKPMGYVVLFGINPLSFWGGAYYMGALPCFKQDNRALSSSISVKNDFLNRGYSPCFLRSFYYIPPVTQEFLIQKLKFFNEMGKMIWPFPAGFYCFIAQKYQSVNPTLLFNEGDDELISLMRG